MMGEAKRRSKRAHENIKSCEVIIGPIYRDWPHDGIQGDCKECGLQCDGDECGLHKSGCVYGGFTDETSYWMIVEGCPLYHGEKNR